jgi:hypothetical protein
MENLSHLVQFVGRWHVVLLHLPIGLLLLLAALELLSLNPRWREATAANRFILGLTIPVTLLAALCGWFLAQSGGYDSRPLFLHRWAGVAVALSACGLFWAHQRGPRKLYRWGLGATVGLTVFAGHTGGSLTHGRSYLTEPIAVWLGPGAGSGVGEGGDATRFATIEPVLTEYCVDCHGPNKSKGGLRVDTRGHLLQGGDSGPAVVGGDASASLLLLRMRLPLKDDEHMPPEGKAQPTGQDLERIRDWISAGAPE